MSKALIPGEQLTFNVTLWHRPLPPFHDIVPDWHIVKIVQTWTILEWSPNNFFNLEGGQHLHPQIIQPRQAPQKQPVGSPAISTRSANSARRISTVAKLKKRLLSVVNILLYLKGKKVLYVDEQSSSVHDCVKLASNFSPISTENYGNSEILINLFVENRKNISENVCWTTVSKNVT